MNFFINFFLIFQFVIIINFVYSNETYNNLINVKIIEEPVHYALNNAANLYAANRILNQNIASVLKSKYRPADYSGPSHLQELNGQCFEHLNENYKWIICPFQNVTQFEQGNKWNTYKGVIGTWYEWEIIDYKFSSLKMLNGDDCGSNGYRQAKIFFICNENSTETKIESVQEPATCKYEIKLKTPLVCFKNYQHLTMNVYPSLNISLRHEWDILFTEYKNELITEKMYNMSLSNIFERAGFIRGSNDLKFLKKKLNHDESEESDISIRRLTTKTMRRPNFVNSDDLETQLNDCKQENKRLKNLLNLDQSNSSSLNLTQLNSSAMIKSK